MRGVDARTGGGSGGAVGEGGEEGRKPHRSNRNDRDYGETWLRMHYYSELYHRAPNLPPPPTEAPAARCSRAAAWVRQQRRSPSWRRGGRHAGRRESRQRPGCRGCCSMEGSEDMLAPITLGTTSWHPRRCTNAYGGLHSVAHLLRTMLTILLLAGAKSADAAERQSFCKKSGLLCGGPGGRGRWWDLARTFFFS